MIFKKNNVYFRIKHNKDYLNIFHSLELINIYYNIYSYDIQNKSRIHNPYKGINMDSNYLINYKNTTLKILYLSIYNTTEDIDEIYDIHNSSLKNLTHISSTISRLLWYSKKWKAFKNIKVISLIF